MKRIRLSVCIATLNRADFIGATLQSLVSQASEDVEIVVVDGASTDNTEEIVGQFAAQCPSLKYIRLEKKGGVDQDYCKAVELATGEYCWLFTDDDLLKPGAIAAVLSELSKGFALIVVNAEVRNPDLTVCLQPRRIRASADQIYAPGPGRWNEFLADAGMYLSFIGSVVIRRDLWNQRDKARYFGTEFVHVGVVFQTPLPANALVMSFPWIIIRYGNAQWVSRSFKIWMVNWPGLIWSFEGLTDPAKRRVVEREPWRSGLRLLFDRAIGHYSMREYHTWLETRLQSPPRRFVCKAIAAIPVGPLNLLARLFARYIMRKNPSIGLYDLEAWRDRQHKIE